MEDRGINVSGDICHQYHRHHRRRHHNHHHYHLAHHHDITITEFEVHRLQTWTMNSDSVENKLQWGERESVCVCVRACVCVIKTKKFEACAKTSVFVRWTLPVNLDLEQSARTSRACVCESRQLRSIWLKPARPRLTKHRWTISDRLLRQEDFVPVEKLDHCSPVPMR